jgi:hypothetical protein
MQTRENDGSTKTYGLLHTQEVREPRRVDRVDLDLKAGEVNLHLTHDAGAKWPSMRLE